MRLGVMSMRIEGGGTRGDLSECENRDRVQVLNVAL